jgi:hypothetical protein
LFSKPCSISSLQVSFPGSTYVTISCSPPFPNTWIMYQITTCPVFFFQSVIFCFRCVFSHPLSATNRSLLVKTSLIPSCFSEAWHIFEYVCAWCRYSLSNYILPIALILEHSSRHKNRNCSTAWSFFSGKYAARRDGQPRVVQGCSDVGAACCSRSVLTFRLILLPPSSGQIPISLCTF